MRPLILCRERLRRIQFLLNRHNGALSVRDFWRSHGICAWELNQAAELGWIGLEVRKPRIGRPSQIAVSAENLNNSPSAKLPPWRAQIPKPISIHHWCFAWHVMGVMSGKGPFGVKISTQVYAYKKAIPGSRKPAGEYASASRLRRHPSVKAACQWVTACLRGEVSAREGMPNSAAEVYQRLSELMG